MSIKNIIVSISAIVVFSSFAMAQTGQPAPKPQDGGQKRGEMGGGRGEGMGGPRMGGPGMGMRGQGGPGMGGHGMMDFNRLNLTDDQKQKIQALQTSHKTMMEANKTQMEEMGKLSQLKREGLLTSVQGTRLTALEAQMQTQMKTTMEKMQNDVLAILTPEQKVLVEQMKKQREDGMKGMHNGGSQQRGPGGRGPGGKPEEKEMEPINN